MIELSGGPKGGESITWIISGIEPDGREYMLIGNEKYIKIDSEIAVYGGAI